MKPLTVPVEVFLRDAAGNRIAGDPSRVESRMTQVQWRQFEDALATAANGWLEANGLDIAGGLAARCPDVPEEYVTTDGSVLTNEDFERLADEAEARGDTA